jgi:hypothetical protein
MDLRLEQLRPETIDRLARKAQAEGLSLDAYLNVHKSGFQREAQDDASRRTEQLGLHDNEPAPTFEGNAHNTIAVSSGISPV